MGVGEIPACRAVSLTDQPLSAICCFSQLANLSLTDNSILYLGTFVQCLPYEALDVTLLLLYNVNTGLMLYEKE
jgi:hypothetical protein